jgi:hypothetical protein
MIGTEFPFDRLSHREGVFPELVEGNTPGLLTLIPLHGILSLWE